MPKVQKVSINDTINIHRVRFNQLIDSIGDLDTLSTQIKDNLDSDGLERNLINALNDIDSRVPVNPFDSEECIALIDSDYVQQRQDFAYTSLIGAPNVLDSADVLSTVENDQTSAQLTGTSVNINVSANDLYYHTTSGSPTSYTFNNPPASGIVTSFILKVTAGGTHNISWPANVEWSNGAAPPAPASGTTNIFVFMTYDGGTTYYGFVPGEAVS